MVPVLVQDFFQDLMHRVTAPVYSRHDSLSFVTWCPCCFGTSSRILMHRVMAPVYSRHDSLSFVTWCPCCFGTSSRILMHRVMAHVYSRDFFWLAQAMHCNVLTQYMYAMMRMIAFAQKYLKGVKLLCILQK